MEEAVRVLKEGGRLFIYDFDLHTFMGKSIFKVETLLGEPGNFFTVSGIKEKLESYGFTVTVNKYAWRYTVDAVLAS